MDTLSKSKNKLLLLESNFNSYFKMRDDENELEIHKQIQSYKPNISCDIRMYYVHVFQTLILLMRCQWKLGRCSVPNSTALINGWNEQLFQISLRTEYSLEVSLNGVAMYLVYFVNTQALAFC